MTDVNIEQLLKRFAPVQLDSTHRSSLSEGDAKCLQKLILASMIIDKVWARQMWENSAEFYFLVNEHLAPDSALFKYIMVNKGPWSALDEGQCFIPQDSAIDMFIPNVPPPGANYYPSDVTKEELVDWMATLSEQERANAKGYFHVIRKDGDNGQLHTVAYSVEYHTLLADASKLLHEAAEATENLSLRNFLQARAEAFLTNDYYPSDVLWMGMDAPLDVTIGPYEVYKDRMFGAKASFEAFISIRDDEETKKLEMFQSVMQELEDHLPLDKSHKNCNIKMNTPIKVVQLVYSAGDVGGTQTIAFCLPNDERVVREQGSKLVLLKNVSAVKHKLMMVPIAKECVVAEQAGLVEFEAFFTHTLCHECCHSIGPHDLPGEGNTVRQAMGDLHSGLEEAKADIVGLWALQYLMDKGMVPKEMEQSIYVSFLAGAIRSIRFGLDEAHGKGLATQVDYLMEQGSVLFDEAEQKFRVDFSSIKDHVRQLAETILTIQGEGSKEKAAALFNKHARISAPLQVCLDRLGDVPVDIFPEFPAAGALL